MLKSRPCKICHSTWHTAMWHKPRKPITQKGKQYQSWIKTKKKWLEINKQPYYWCHYCGKQMTRTQLTLDHKEARSRNPSLRYVLSNLVPCCWFDNAQKGSLDHNTYSTKYYPEHKC